MDSIKQIKRHKNYKDIKVLRIIKHFPKASNQAIKKMIGYNQHGNEVFKHIATYTSTIETRNKLPKRITVIEDDNYMSVKEWKNYEGYEYN